MKITAEKFNSFQFCRQTIIYVNSYYVQDTTHYREKKTQIPNPAANVKSAKESSLDNSQVLVY